jgi:hypothetical protein
MLRSFPAHCSGILTTPSLHNLILHPSKRIHRLQVEVIPQSALEFLHHIGASPVLEPDAWPSQIGQVRVIIV